MMVHSPIPLVDQPIFKGLTAPQIKTLEECSSFTELKAGDALFSTGKPANHFYLIQSGKISLQVYTQERGPQEIQTVGPGEILGWSWISYPNIWQFDAKALTDTNVFVFDARLIKKHYDSDPELGKELLVRFVGVLAERLTAARKKIVELCHNK